jgi:hypothetical protein
LIKKQIIEKRKQGKIQEKKQENYKLGFQLGDGFEVQNN